MKNRAKCKLCESVIESFHSTDYVTCKCGHIAVDGGNAMKCFANDFNNFVRVDENGNEILVKVIEEETNNKISRREMINMLDEMIKGYERLPDHAMSEPVTHYDLVSALILLSSLFKSFEE